MDRFGNELEPEMANRTPSKSLIWYEVVRESERVTSFYLGSCYMLLYVYPLALHDNECFDLNQTCWTVKSVSKKLYKSVSKNSGSCRLRHNEGSGSQGFITLSC